MSRVLAGVADSGPVVVLAGIAAAGSFTHIRDTAHQHGQHGWMAWAIAICIDLTCVMAARERHRDQRTGRRTGPITWPTVVLAGGILLSLAANLAQAEPTVWGWVTAGTPAAAFLVAVSMLERRATRTPKRAAGTVVPPSFGHPSPSPRPSPAPSSASAVASGPSSASSPVQSVGDGGCPQITAVPDQTTRQDANPPDAARADGGEEMRPGRRLAPVAAAPSDPPDRSGPPVALVEYARRVATQHHTAHGRPITRDALRARLGVSNQLASDLLRHLRTDNA